MLRGALKGRGTAGLGTHGARLLHATSFLGLPRVLSPARRARREEPRKDGPSPPFRPAAVGEGWLWQAMSSKDTRKRLEEEGLKAKKGLGQNFMVDDTILRKIVHEAAGISEGDLVVEVGPGTGNLTRHLLAAKAQVLAIEKDSELFSRLQVSNLGVKQAGGGGGGGGELRLVHADVLDIDLPALADQFIADMTPLAPLPQDGDTGSSAPPRRRVKVVANLPYNITTEFLKAALPMGRQVSDLYLMLQDEVGQKFAKSEAGDDLYRAMSVRARFFSQPSYLFPIPRHAYFPQPNVTSCVVRFRLRDPADYPTIRGTPQEFTEFVNLAFISRRKMLKNNCARIYGEERVAAALESLGLDERVRAERLQIDEFVALFNVLGPSGPGGHLRQTQQGFVRERAAPRPYRERAGDGADDGDSDGEGGAGSSGGAPLSLPTSAQRTSWPEFDNGPEPGPFEDPDKPPQAARSGGGAGRSGGGGRAAGDREFGDYAGADF